MYMRVARDIEECSVCHALYFPGDEVVLTPEGMAHEDHFGSEKTFEDQSDSLVSHSK